MAVPSVTNSYDDAYTATVETYVNRKRAVVNYEYNLVLGAVLNSEHVPGMVGERPVLKMGTRPRVFRTNARRYNMPIATDSSTNTTWFTLADELPTNLDTVGTMQFETPRYITDFAAIADTEVQENSGPDKRLDILQERIDQAMRTMADNVETAWWSLNSSTVNTKRMLGIQNLVPVDPTTGTVWGIDRATFTYQRSNTITVSDTFANVGLANFRTAYTTAAGTNGTDIPTLIMTTALLWNEYTELAESRHRIIGDRNVDLGFPMAQFRGIPISYTGDCPTGYAYWLNLRYYRLMLPKGWDYTVKRYDSPPNQALSDLWRIKLSMNHGFERYDRQLQISGFTG